WHLWAAFASNGMGVRRCWPPLPFHGRVWRGDGLLHRQQKTSSARPTPGPVRSHLRRTRFPVHVLRGFPTFGHLPCTLQSLHLHHWPDRPSIAGRITHRSLRPPLRKLGFRPDILKIIGISANVP